MTTSVRYVLIALISCCLMLCAIPANAGTVAIVQPQNDTTDLTEAVSRIHGELLSVGLDVKIVHRPLGHGASPTDASVWLEQVAREGQIDAVIDIIGAIAPDAVDVWVIEKAPRQIEVSRINLEPNTRNASETLAIRAVEVLRSTFLEKDMEAKARRPLPVSSQPIFRPIIVPPSNVSRQNNAPQYVERVGVIAGVSVLTGFEGAGVAMMPTAGVVWRARSWFELQASLAGLGTRPTASTAVGSAQIARQYATFGGCFGFHANRTLWPFLSFSAGVMHTSIEGHAELPWQEHNVDRWSFLIDSGLGSRLMVTERYYLTLAAHAQIAEPYVVVHVVDTVVATIGRPSFVLTLTVGAWL